MNSPVTVDASVFVSAFMPAEPAHPASRQFMASVRREGIPIIVPFLVLPEISAALSRSYGKPQAAKAFVLELGSLPQITFVNLDKGVAGLAADIAAKHRLRGSDAVYAAVAFRFGAELITLDGEQLDRLPKLLSVRKPR